MRAPFVSGSGSVGVRELLLVKLESADGHVGFGEAAPLPGYDGVALDDVRAALEGCIGPLTDSDGVEREELLAECARVAVLPQAVSAIDLALWDLTGRRSGEPVWRLLGARSAEAVEVNATIASADRAGAASEAVSARGAGFRCVKLKVGIGDDAGRLAAVRAVAGREMAIRLDANGAWSVDEALTTLRGLEPAGIELCEEPVSGLDRVAEVAARVRTPVAIDETAREPAALERRACEMICLKIARCGGISGVIEAARRARAVGYEVYLASTLDGPFGISAALHAAAIVRPRRPCGLATLAMFEGRVDPLPARDGRIAIPTGSGLGDGLTAWYSLSAGPR